MHKYTMMTLALASATLFAAEEKVNDWENPAVNSINRLPARAYSMPLASEAAALTDALEPETPFKKSLNGMWKISWVGDPALRNREFYKTSVNDADWFEIDVPSCVELRGFGSPGYTNVRFPTADTTTPGSKDFCKVLDRDTKRGNYNPVSSYRTRFTVPADWSGRDVILRFDGVYSAYYVWVNGEKVGYAEDSKLPSEFDITRFLKKGENLLAVEVYRWSDGSFLEDQDMFRYSGIYRDVTLWARPKGGIWDFAVKTTPVGGFENWRLDVTGAELDSAVLYDAAFKKVADLKKGANGFSASLKPSVWSAEKPYLYTLVLKKGADIRAKRVGFKHQAIVGNTFTVNGQPVKFKGVNRHECSPENGRTVSMDEMVRDITLMKQYNVNTVRTCHYPDHHSWYDLCDRYGLYVVAEANVEGHEPGYDKRGMGRFPEWEHSIVERNERNCIFHRDNPCVTMWSMGNETGHGDCFRKAMANVRQLDPTRPLHWERGNEDADVDSTMYPSVEWLEKRGKLGDSKDGSLKSAAGGEGFAISGHKAGKCAFLCEYAHAMGNAIGNFQEYWDTFYAHPSLAGGCIWDWIDQGIWKYTDRVDPKTGCRERFLAYGGDWDEEPNDGPFCCNGVIDPERHVTAKLVEVGHVHRNLVVTRGKDGRFELWNRFCFTFADEFDATCSLVVDGKVVATKPLDVPRLGPLSRGELKVPEFGVKVPGECFVNFSFALKADTLWAAKGWIVARDQVPVPRLVPDAPVAPLAPAQVKVAQDERTVTVDAGTTKAVFCRKSGTFCELVMNGKTILKDAAPGVVAGPQVTCARAFTDNDRWMRDGDSWGENRFIGGVFSKGLTQLNYHARPIEIRGNKVKIVVDVTGSKSAGYVHTAVYDFKADGSISVENEVVPVGDFPPSMPRLGLSFRLDKSLEQMAYYGRGPRENYVDRKTGSFIGLWKSTVTEQFEPYVRPQDNGCKSDVRWVEFTDVAGKGVRFTGSIPLYAQALHYGWEDLEFSRHRNGQKRFRSPLVARDEVMLNLDVAQTGLGGASCGPGPMEKYRYHAKTEKWTLSIFPVK